MKKYVMYKNAVWEVVRDDHFNDLDFRLIQSTEHTKSQDKKILVVHVNSCTPLDPVLNILFERNDDANKNGDG